MNIHFFNQWMSCRIILPATHCRLSGDQLPQGEGHIRRPSRIGGVRLQAGVFLAFIRHYVTGFIAVVVLPLGHARIGRRTAVRGFNCQRTAWQRRIALVVGGGDKIAVLSGCRQAAVLQRQATGLANGAAVTVNRIMANRFDAACRSPVQRQRRCGNRTGVQRGRRFRLSRRRGDSSLNKRGITSFEFPVIGHASLTLAIVQFTDQVIRPLIDKLLASRRAKAL
jgi:hypothetical protein